MRGITVRSAARTSAGKSGGDPAPRRFPWITPVTAVITVATLLALGLRIYLLARPGYLLGVTEYDDGPYFGSAVRLVDGILPYRSFVLVQPPGITLLMVPAALMAKVIGTAGGMVIGRILTMLASAAAVVLGGLLVRHRGLLAVIVCCGIIAVYPDSVLTARTVLVEPWLVLFCLAGALAVFDGDRPTQSRGGCCGAGWRSASPARSRRGPSCRCSWSSGSCWRCARSRAPRSTWPGWRQGSWSPSCRSPRWHRGDSTTAW